jgi:T-complex protein 1 subunit theta
MVIKRGPEGSIPRAADTKVAVYTQGFDTSGTETKGTVLIKSAEELTSYAKSEACAPCGHNVPPAPTTLPSQLCLRSPAVCDVPGVLWLQEARMEEIVKGVADAGVGVVASGMAIGEMAIHFLEKYGIMAVKIPSKFDLRRLCRATGAVGLVKVAPPTPDEVGHVKELAVEEIGGTKCLVLRQDGGGGEGGAAGAGIATVVLRGATEGLLNDAERAVDDGVNSFKALGRDARAVAAGGAAELALARALRAHGERLPGLQQYAVCAFADALEVVPRTLAENSGLDATVAVSGLHAAHAAGATRAGLDVETGAAVDLGETEGLVDLYIAKWWAIRLAADAAATVLRVDQIIMAKMAGGPAPKSQGNWDEE